MHFIFYLKKLKKKFFFWLHCATCGILVPQLGIEPAPLQWKHGVLITGPPGKSLKLLHFKLDFHRVEPMKVISSGIIVISINGSGKMTSLTLCSTCFYLFGCSLSPLLASLLCQTCKCWNIPELGPGLASFFHLFFLFNFIWFCCFKCHISL